MLTVIHKKFLTLWKDTDPGLSEVDDAKQRTGWVEVDRKFIEITRETQYYKK